MIRMMHTPFRAADDRIQRANAPSRAKTKKVKTRNEVNLTSDNYGVLSTSPQFSKAAGESLIGSTGFSLCSS
jgi:hypothetical protein